MTISGPNVDVASAAAAALCAKDKSRHHALRFRPLRQTFENYLCRAPLSHALFRAAECRRLAGVEILEPALDLGCSTGEFASYALSEPIDLGLDLLRERLALARRRRGHAALVQGDAARLPLADERFATVLAVSVCEHFAEPRRAMDEVFRVLRPGGRFVATVVLADLHERLFYPKLLKWLGLRRLAGAYLRLHDHVFRHETLQSREEWEKMLLDAGFRLLVSRRILSPRLIGWFDFWLATALAVRLLQTLGVRSFWRHRWVRRTGWRFFQWLDREAEQTGTVLLVVAEKQE